MGGLKGGGGGEDGGFVAKGTDDLEADGQAINEAAGDAGGGVAGEVEWEEGGVEAPHFADRFAVDDMGPMAAGEGRDGQGGS